MSEDSKVHEATFLVGKPIAAPCDLDGCHYAEIADLKAKLEAAEGEVSASHITIRNLETWYNGTLDILRKAEARISLLEAAHNEWTEKERAAIDELMASQGLSEHAVLRQGLMHYQQIVHRVRAGETCTWSGDEQRNAEFSGKSLHPSAPDARDRVVKAARASTRSERPAGKKWVVIEFASEKEAVGFQYDLNMLRALTGGPQDA